MGCIGTITYIAIKGYSLFDDGLGMFNYILDSLTVGGSETSAAGWSNQSVI